MKRIKYFALAALVAFAACDEADEIVPPPPVTGSISGVVSIEGAGASGVTVTLSSGASATTDGSGAYAFSGVAAGSYTVSISGFPSDAAFATTAKAATISTAGQVATVSFDGSYVRTSAIFGSVAAGGMGLAGVNVSIGSASTSTDANGQFSFTGLRAGTYTVSISGVPAGYSFGTTSQAVTLGVGESKAASFSGTLLMTAKVTGRLFIDENDNNDVYDGAALEANLAVANITIELEGGGVASSITTETAADGTFEFTGLAAGSYRVTVLNVTGASIDTDLPGNVAFGEASTSKVVGPLAPGSTGTANFGFDITKQAIKVYATLGTDAGGAGTNPIKGWKLDLYDTDANANVGGATGRLGQVTTDANGEAIFRFARNLDVGPGGSVDNIVYAATNTVPAGHAIDALSEAIIEIKYNSWDSVAMAPDTFDALNNALVVGFKTEEVDGDTGAGWNVALRVNKSSTFGTTTHGVTDANGMVYFNLVPLAFPDTIWVRLSGTQTANGSHGWKSNSIVADEGTLSGNSLRYIWNGTTPASDTIMMGTEIVKYTDSDIVYRGHHEADDSTGTTPTFTVGDNFIEAGNVQVKIMNATGTVTVRANGPLTAGTGIGTRFNLPTDSTYMAIASSVWGQLKVLKSDTVVFTLDGGDTSDTLNVLGGGAGFSTFAYKMKNQMISGVILAADGSAAAGMKVRVAAGPGNIQGMQDTTVVTSALGAYTTNNNLWEGPYTVSVTDSTTSSSTVWGFSAVLKTTSAPLTSGTANNTDAHTGVRDAAGNGNVVANNPIVNFQADRSDTKIQGVIVNDRDGDLNTIDPTEGLAGATVELYVDNSGTPTVNADSLVATTTTDASGAFSFSNLPERVYIVKPVAGTPAGSNVSILRAVTKGDTAIVKTAAAAAAAGTGNPDATLFPGAAGRTVGITTGFNTTGLSLPAWNYGTSTLNLVAGASAHRQPHFTFLYADGVATGVVTKTGVAVAGMTISAVKCGTAAGWTSPPTIPIGAGTCTPTGSAVNVVTDATGTFSFAGLQEGVWLVTANPATAGLPDAITTGLFQILGTGDIETGNFVFP